MQEPVGRRNPPPADLDDGQVGPCGCRRACRTDRARRRGSARGAGYARAVDRPGREPRGAARARPTRRVDLVLRRSALQHRPHAQARSACARARDPRAATAPASAGAATGARSSVSRSSTDRFDDFAGVLEPRLREARRVLRAGRARSSSTSTPREVALREGAARPDLRARVVHERDRLGLRLRRAHEAAAGPRSTTRSCGTRVDPARYTFDYDAIDRIPYMAPGLVGPEKAARGKTPTDVWWQTIVPTNGRERTGYATQKPLAILTRIVARALAPGRPRARLLRRQRHHRRGRGARWAATSCWSTRTPRRSRVMRKRLAFAATENPDVTSVCGARRGRC